MSADHLAITDEDRVQVSPDGRTVWVHTDDGSTVGRFSKVFGMDVHTTVTEQLAGAGQCLRCTHTAPGPAQWEEFCDLIHLHYGIVVDRKALSFEAGGVKTAGECTAAPAIAPAAVREGLAVRRRPAGRICSVARLSDDRSKVLVNDGGQRFWVGMASLVKNWY
jgi:hypothetical protein